MAESDFNWPKKGSRAFGPTVPSDNQGRLEAFVLPAEGTYLAGFQRAADMIVTAAESDDLNPDDLFFPVAYLYRHHLELMLKELVRLGVRLGSFDGCEEILGGHNLHKLWNNAKQLVKVVWPDSPEKEFEAVEQVILEFHKLDPSGQAFRYARDRNGGLHLASGPERVDLSNLKSVVDEVSRFLDAAYAGIDNCDPGADVTSV